MLVANSLPVIDKVGLSIQHLPEPGDFFTYLAALLFFFGGLFDLFELPYVFSVHLRLHLPVFVADLPVIDGLPQTYIVVPWVDLELNDLVFEILGVLQLCSDVVVDRFKHGDAYLVVEVSDANPLRIILTHEVDHSLGQIRGFGQRVHAYPQSLESIEDGLLAAVGPDHKLHDSLLFVDLVVVHIGVEFKYN